MLFAYIVQTPLIHNISLTVYQMIKGKKTLKTSCIFPKKNCCINQKMRPSQVRQKIRKLRFRGPRIFATSKNTRQENQTTSTNN